MRAQDLRIGNLHYYHVVDELDERKDWDEVCITDIDDLVWLSKNPNDPNYKPIPITEENIKKIRCKYYKDNTRIEFNCTPPLERQVENNYWSREVHDFAVLHLSPSYRRDKQVPEFWFIWITSHGTGSNWFMPLMDIHRHPLKYIHQLQNIYLDLTGNELEAKL